MIKQSTLERYQGHLRSWADLVRENLKMQFLVLKEPVTVAGDVLPAGADGFCLPPNDGSPIPPDFSFATSIPFLASGAGGREWKNWAAVPWGNVLADDEDLPGPMRPWTALTDDDVTAIQEIVCREGLILVAGTGRQTAEGTCGTAATISLDGLGSTARIQVSWTTRGETHHQLLPAHDCAVAIGADAVFLYRHDDVAVLVNRACVGLALMNWAGSPADRGTITTLDPARERDQHPASPRNIVGSFIQHGRNPERTATFIVSNLFGDHRLRWKPAETDAYRERRQRYEAARVAECRQAALRGTVAAMRDLGLVLMDGEMGVERDPVAGVGWLQRAAEHGDPRAQTRLGYAYGDGEGGLEPDTAAMIGWFTAAAKQGHASAAYALAGVYDSRTSVPAARGLASETLEVYWLQKAAEAGHAFAAFALSGAYLRGRGGLPIDEEAHDRWLERSEELKKVEQQADAEIDRRERAAIESFQD